MAEIPDPPTAGLRRTDILRRADSERRKAYELLRRALIDRSSIKSDRLGEAIRAIEESYANVGLAAHIAGMLSPWAPHLQVLPRGWKRTREELPIEISPTRETTTEEPTEDRQGIGAWDIHHEPTVRLLAIWQYLESSLAWLARVTGDPSIPEGAALREQIEASVESSYSSLIDRIADELRESITLGEGRDSWRARVESIVDMRAGMDETLSRTTYHRAYHRGQREILAQPVIEDVFPYRRYLATKDNRVRRSHAEMDGMVYHRDSALAHRATSQLMDYNCRCSEVPMTEEEAMDIGVSPGGLPIGSALLA